MDKFRYTEEDETRINVNRYTYNYQNKPIPCNSELLKTNGGTGGERPLLEPSANANTRQCISRQEMIHEKVLM